MIRFHKIWPAFLIFLVWIHMASCGNQKPDNPKTDYSKLPEELAVLNKQIDEDPKNPELFHKRAVYYLENKDVEKALSDINKAIVLDSKNQLYFLTLSDVYFAGGKISKCEETLNKAIEINSDNAEPYLKLAELYYYLSDFKKVFDYSDKAYKVNALNAKVDFIRGMAFKDMGDTLKAVKSFEKAVEKDQQYFHAYMQLGLIYSAKRNGLAIDYFNNALKLNPQSTEALYALAYFYQENMEYNKAIERYTMIVQIDKNYKQAYYNLGYIHLVYLRVYDVAAKHFSDAIKCDPNYFEAYYNRGYCYELMGNINFARGDYQQALKIKTNYQRAIEGLNRLDRISNL